MCHVALDFDDEYRTNDDPLSYEQRQYELPDNRVIEVDHRKRIRAAELLFNPENSNLEFRLEDLPHSSYPEFKGNMRGGIAKLAFESIK